MALFRKKEVEVSKKAAPEDEERSLSAILKERVMTAEGWRRKNYLRAQAASKKAAVK